MKEEVDYQHRQGEDCGLRAADPLRSRTTRASGTTVMTTTTGTATPTTILILCLRISYGMPRRAVARRVNRAYLGPLKCCV